MLQQKVSSLKTYFDELAETDGDDECRAWLNKVFNSKTELLDFVASRLKIKEAGKYVGFLKGSFNFSFRFSFDRGQNVIIRFPKPGHTAFRDEKIANEVQTMEYPGRNTTIPIPRVHSWGLTAEGPQQFGPFIIMDFVDGALLSTILQQPTANDQESLILNPNIDCTALNIIYHQIADYILQLSQLKFTHIGAISKGHSSNTWSVTRRPLTYNMNELATVAGYPDDQLPAAPFDCASDYLRSVAKQHLTHLWTQRNLADNPEIAHKRFIARHRLAQLIQKYCVDDGGPFVPFCDDMRPSNMLVNPETLRITAVLDWEFTNAMPAQFTYDPPWWLLLSGPEMWLDRCAMAEFVALYEPRMEQFLQALERVEEDSTLISRQPSEQRLSTRMRHSWRTGRFWFNYAARKSFEVDAIYWAALHDNDAGAESFEDENTRAEMESFTQIKMEQLRAYEEECTARFSSES